MGLDSEQEVADAEALGRLEDLLKRGRQRRGLSDDDYLQLPRLYRLACSVVARQASGTSSPKLAREARALVSRAHTVLYRHRHGAETNLARALWNLFWVEAPRAIRAEWRLVATSLALVYGLALFAGIAVANDLDLAPSLLSPAVVENQIEQLEATAEGEPFRGNFTFGLGESPHTAGWLMAHNMGVSVIFFAAALIPPIYLLLLGLNALMLGTYTAVAWHWGQAGAISSILWCHGVLEIQSIVLAGTGGLVLIRAWVLPGPWSRRHAMQLESRRAIRLLAPVFPLLFCAGMIEAFVSPHAPFEVRIATAVGTGILLLSWVLFAGREKKPAGSS